MRKRQATGSLHTGHVTNSRWRFKLPFHTFRAAREVSEKPPIPRTVSERGSKLSHKIAFHRRFCLVASFRSMKSRPVRHSFFFFSGDFLTLRGRTSGERWGISDAAPSHAPGLYLGPLTVVFHKEGAIWNQWCCYLWPPRSLVVLRHNKGPWLNDHHTELGIRMLRGSSPCTSYNLHPPPP